MNCEVPHNEFETDEFSVFGGVIALSIVVITVYLLVVRHWWTQAKRRQRTM